MYCTVVTQSRSVGIGEGLTYSCGDEVNVGALVRIPLRKQVVEGIVIAVSNKKPDDLEDVKHIVDVVSSDPLIPQEMTECAKTVAFETLSSLRHSLGLWLPAPKWSQLLPSSEEGFSLASSAPVRGAKRLAVTEYLASNGWTSAGHLQDHAGASVAVLRAMAKEGILERSYRRESMPGPERKPPAMKKPSLNAEQKRAYELCQSSDKPVLLFGVTGSGKTEVYASLAVDVIKRGGQAIVLFPEIFLSESIVERFAGFIPRERISLVHSKLTPAARRKEWLRARTGEACLVLGSRSALFAPCRNLQLVVLDEEHEWTYKNERMPRYHARTVARDLAQKTGSHLVLGSATPSIESWQAAKDNVFALARLPHRYKRAPLPTVRIVDLADVKFGKAYPFSSTMIEAIQERLDRQEQCVLFLNHRGTATALLCLDCRRRVISPESQLPFTVHEDRSGRPYLLDHTTGKSANVPDKCPHCQGMRLHPVGAGTQRIEKLLAQLFPTARVLRADSDTLTSTDDMRELLNTMSSGRADILIGTQTVALGLDLPKVTLAGVLVADVGLSLPHFRASERVFQLLTQLSGRSGRHTPGDVIIQTFRPEAIEIVAAAKHDAELFLEQELRIRAATQYPPSSKMVRLLLRGPSAMHRARQLHAKLSGKAMRMGSIVKISVAPTFSGGGTEWQLLLRGADPVALLRDEELPDITVDVDPVETL